MSWFFAVLIVLAIGGVAVVALGYGAPLAEEHGDRPTPDVPRDRALTGADLRGIRFSTSVRGYRASDVDALLARLAVELDLHSDPGDGAGSDFGQPPHQSGTLAT